MLALLNPAGTWPFVILAICVVAVIVLITRLRVHAFLALIGVAILAGVLSPVGSLPGEGASGHWIQAVELATVEFGTVCGTIGLVIALASIIGVCVMESGAADKVVRRSVAVCGEQRAGFALLAGGFPLGLPIFFDTFFMLLIPLARALRLRTGRDYTLFVMAICCAGAVTHTLVAPHPGPLAVAETLKVDLGWSVIAGTLAAIPPVLVGWQLSKRVNRRWDVPLRETAGVTLAELTGIANTPERDLPSFVASLLPVLLPILLISTASFTAAFGGVDRFGPFHTVMGFTGNRNIALLIGALLAMRLVVRQKRLAWHGLGGVLGPALETAGVIVFITAAGGAFGGMLRHAGVGEAIRAAAEGRALNLILLAWTVAVVLKFAQGSATVSVLTTAAMMTGVTQGVELPYHPMYLFLAIGFGGLGISWMNDSGFWVIGRLSGFTERETLRTWTVVAFAMSCAGLVETWLLSRLLPFR